MSRRRLGEPEELEVGQLKVDRRYQRPIYQPRVKKIADRWEPRLVKVPRVSRREDGDYILDGQHTVAAAHAKFGPKHKLLCEVFLDLSLQEEADMFYRQDEGAADVCSADKYRARLVAEEPVAVAINDTVTRAGLVVGGYAETSISAISALERVQVVHHTLKPSLETLKLWAAKCGPDVYRRPVLLSVGALIARYHREIDLKRLAEVLKRRSPEELMADIKTKRRMEHSGNEETHGAQLLRAWYNTRLKGQKLPAWSKDA